MAGAGPNVVPGYAVSLGALLRRGEAARPGEPTVPREAAVQIRLTSVPVDDQDTAVRFYTEMLGFAKQVDITMGEFRWLTVTSPEGVELVLEPMAFPPARVYQEWTRGAAILCRAR